MVGLNQFGLHSLGSNGYVSTLRASSSSKVNQELIKDTTKYFLLTTEPGAYHFVWESRQKMVSWHALLNT